MKTASVLLLTLLGLAQSVYATPSRTSRFQWKETSHVYAFGDSYTFVQGTRGRANYSFIGDAFDLAFTPAEILTSEIVPHNTSSDGANWIEYLTGCFSGSPFFCPRQLWDFAFAGSDISSSLLPLHHNFTVPLVDQVKQYVTYASHVLPHPTGRTLTTWWIGINDTGDTIGNTTITDYTMFWQAEMAAYFSAVTLAHTQGGLKTHLFINVPPEERSPANAANATKAEKEKSLVDGFNTALKVAVAGFAKEHKDAVVLSYDAHAFFTKVLDAPAKYGFKNVTGYCACDDDSYFWYNTGHPTQKVHQLLAQDLESFLERSSHR